VSLGEVKTVTIEAVDVTKLEAIYMRSTNVIMALALGCGLNFSALADDHTTADEVKSGARETVTEVKASVYEALEKNSLTINFAEGGAAVSEGDRQDIEALRRNVGDQARSKRLIIAAWSDKAFPAEKDAELGKESVDLAANRAQEIRNLVTEGVNFNEVEVVNMAEPRGAFLGIFRTSSTRVKDAYVGDEEDNTRARHEAKVLKDKGGPGKAVVFFYNAEALEVN
jgi:hypothetical protein